MLQHILHLHTAKTFQLHKLNALNKIEYEKIEM